MLQTIVGIIILGLIVLAIVDVLLYVVLRIKKWRLKRGEDKFNVRLRETSDLLQNAKRKDAPEP